MHSDQRAQEDAHREASGHSALGHVPHLLTGLSTALGVAHHIGSTQNNSQYHNQSVLCGRYWSASGEEAGK